MMPFPFMPPFAVAGGLTVPVFEGEGKGGGVLSTPGNTFAATLPSGITSGDLLLLAVTLNEASARSLTVPSGWSTLYNQVLVAGDLRRAALFYKSASGSEGASVTVTADTFCNYGYVSFRISNWGGSEVSSPNAGTGANADGGPSFAPSWGSAPVMWLSVVHWEDQTSGTPTEPSGYGNKHSGYRDLGGTYLGVVSMATKTSDPGTSEDPGAWTSTAANWRSRTVAVKGA